MRRLTTMRVVGVLAATALGLVSGCVAMPVEGPVVGTDDSGEHRSRSGAAYEPPLPVDGASAQEVVLGFLEAMKATPVSTTVAAEFLSVNARGQWRPEDGTLTYRGLTAPGGAGAVRMWINAGQRYDSRGRWSGPLEEGAERLDFPMVKEGGEWRIDRAPNALLVPETWFETNFSRLSVYFLEPSGRTLVPEPTHLPRGESLATNLVRNLLAGQSVETSDVVRTAVPTGLSLAVNAVPVDETGVARLALKGREDSLARGISPGFRAQLSWTLRQAPQVRRMRVTLNGVPVMFEGGAEEVSVLGAEDYAPYGRRADDTPFAFADGHLLRGRPGHLRETDGPFGRGEVGASAVSVALDGRSAVGVVRGGTALVRALTEDAEPAEEKEPTDAAVSELAGGFTEVNALAQDAAGRVWVLDRTRAGARFLVLHDGQRREVTLPGATGTEVRSMLVSPDATRVITVVAGTDRDRIFVHRLILDPSTGVFEPAESRTIAPQLPADRQVLDLGWASSGDVRVLSALSADLSEVRTVAVEGAPDSDTTTSSFRVRPGGRGLATSLVPGAEEYVFAGQDVRDVGEPASVLPILPPEVTWFGYAG